MGTHTDEFIKTSAWHNFDATLTVVLSQFFQTEVVASTIPTALPDPAYASSISMSDIEHLIELGIGVIADTASAGKIAEQLFGDASMAEDEEMIADIISELANLAMGGVKTSFAREGFTFCSGIPEAQTLQSLHEFMSPYQGVVARAFTATELGLLMLTGVKPKSPKRIPTERLAEGMVLAEDYRTDAGLLLLHAGTRLSTSYVHRLVRCDPHRLVKVCIPD